MFRKKILSFILSVACILPFIGSLAACSNTKSTGELKIVATIFPQYDWTKNIVGDTENVSVKMLVNNGIDLHSYQPSVKDIATISTCDLFIYVGGESDEWVEDALKNATNKNMRVINLLEVLGEGAKEEEIIEGMEGEEEGGEKGEEEIEYDEHVWLSLKNASVFCDEITNVLCEIDKDHAQNYISNSTAYKQELKTLDDEYLSAVQNGTKNTLLFADRFPFRYLVEDYGLKYYAAFVGCSAETEASFKTIKFLAEKVDELSLSVILTIEGANHNIAQTVKNSTTTQNQQILSVNSLQSVTANDVSQGTTYLSVMQSNLEVLKQAIN